MSATPDHVLLRRVDLRSSDLWCSGCDGWPNNAVSVLVVINANQLTNTSRRGRSNISTFLWIIILLMFLLDTAMCIIDVNNAVREITYTLMSTSSASLADRYKLTNNLPYPVEGALYAFMVRRSMPRIWSN